MEPFTSELILSNKRLFRYDIIWCKGKGTDFLNSNRKPLRSHENICVFYKRQPTYNPQKSQGKPYKCKSAKKSDNYGMYDDGWLTQNTTGERYPITTIQFMSCDNKNKKHPTQKPVDLLEYLIMTYSNAGDTVMDNCMGSGSTGCACVNTMRNFIGIELDPDYFKIANERISDAIQLVKQNKCNGDYYAEQDSYQIS